MKRTEALGFDDFYVVDREKYQKMSDQIFNIKDLQNVKKLDIK